MERSAGQRSSRRLVFRFAVGTTEIVGERLAAALRVFDEQRAAGGGAVTWPMPAVRHVLLGALCSAPSGLRRALARARPLAERTGRLADRGLRSLGRVPGGPRVQSACHRARVRASTQLARWAVLGQQEEVAARSLASTALPELFELAMGALADSPDLQELLQEQSEGLAAEAVNRLREHSRGADEAAQGLASRLLHRGSGRAWRPALSER